MLMQQDNSSPYVLMITKWYPYDKDPQFGVFIRKQALAISLYRKIIVYSAHSHTEPSRDQFDLEVENNGGLTEYRMYYKKSTSAFSFFINGILYLKAWNKTRKIIWKQHGKPGILHAYILLRPAIITYMCSVIYNIPFVVSEQWSGYPMGKFSGKSVVSKALSKFVFKKASARTVVSNFLRSSMENLGFSKPIQVIPNVIEIQASPVKIPSDKIIILVVADLVDEIKNISGILKSFAKALNENPSLQLKIIGQGKDEHQLKLLAQQLKLSPDKVQFMGLKSNPEVYVELWNCDFLLMNSRFETFSLICAEALSCGKPVISTRCGGPEEFINSSNGILIPVNDDIALFEALNKMSVSYRDFSSENIRQESIRKFSPEGVGAKFEAIYSQIAP